MCGKTARTVRREGRTASFSTPIEGLVVDDEGLVVDDEGLVGDDNFLSAPSCQPVGQQAHQLMEHQVPFARTSG